MDGMLIMIASSCKCITCQDHEDADRDYNQRLMRSECRVQSRFQSVSTMTQAENEGHEGVEMMR